MFRAMAEGATYDRHRAICTMVGSQTGLTIFRKPIAFQIRDAYRYAESEIATMAYYEKELFDCHRYRNFATGGLSRQRAPFQTEPDCRGRR